MGLILNIYKPARGDSSAGGISSRFDEVCVINVDGPFDPADDRPAVRLVRGATPGTVRVVPADDRPAFTNGPMFGGCYVDTSDSRFSRAVEAITGARFYGAVALHDRFESYQ